MTTPTELIERAKELADVLSCDNVFAEEIILSLASALEAAGKENERLQIANRTRHDYDIYCSACGKAHILDTVIPSEIWNQIAEPNELLCTLCIDERLQDAEFIAEAQFFYAGHGLTSKLYDAEARAQAAEASVEKLREVALMQWNALEAYSRHEHWMQLAENAPASTVWIAICGSSSTADGYSLAEQTLNAVADIMGARVKDFDIALEKVIARAALSAQQKQGEK